MQTPTIGRIVHYTEPKPEGSYADEPRFTWPAIVTAVHSETIVNLQVIRDDAREPLQHVTSVPRRDTVSLGPSDYWEWPEYVAASAELEPEAEKAEKAERRPRWQ